MINIKSLAVILFILLIIPVSISADVTAFSMPENSYPALSQFLEGTKHDIIIGAYTITSNDIASMLVGLLSKNMSIEILIEKSPVGGMKHSQKKILCLLQEHGANIMLYDKPLRFYHAKYIIRDHNDIMVSTDNFVAGSFPFNITRYSAYSRGWGAIVYNTGIAADFLEMYEKDIAESLPFTCLIDEYNISTTTTTNTYFRSKSKYKFRHKPLPPRQQASKIDFIFSPDNSKQKIMETIDSAKKILYIEQLYIYKNWDTGLNPFLSAVIKKARQGIDVRILLDARWYNIEKNNKTMQYLFSLNMSNLQIFLHPSMQIHAKGIIADSTAVISSVNWNENSVTNNRETGVIITGAPVEYYKNIFLKDWQKAVQINYLTGYATGIFQYSTELIFLSIGLVVILIFLLKNNAFR